MQVVDELSELGGGLDISAEKNKAARLNPAKRGRGRRIEFFAWDTGEKKLTERVRSHPRVSGTAHSLHNCKSGEYKVGMTGIAPQIQAEGEEA